MIDYTIWASTASHYYSTLDANEKNTLFSSFNINLYHDAQCQLWFIVSLWETVGAIRLNKCLQAILKLATKQ